VLGADADKVLRAADARGSRYVLVHVGPDDGVPGGSYERAHYRVSLEQLPELASRLRSREALLVRAVAFGYKNGLPPEADWVIDCRFLDNPYWVEELKPLDGRDERVRAHVLAQAAAGDLADRLAETLKGLLPLYRAQGRDELMVAFGCTGGRHRSVVVADEVARRLGEAGIDVEITHRDLDAAG
jgi:RNase adaptor protein for sRNA GlmZ degradation